MALDNKTIKQIKHLIIFTVIAVIIGINYTKVLSLFGKAFSICRPLIVGLIIAFVLNVPMREIENRLPVKKGKRPISMLLSILLIIGTMSFVSIVVLPQLSQTITDLQSQLPTFFTSVQEQLTVLFAENPEITEMINSFNFNWKEILAGILAIMSNSITVILSSAVSTFTTVLIGFIFAIYILLQKETLARQFTKVFNAFLSENTAKNTLSLLRFTEQTFSKFLTGQCLEALILGAMFVVTLTIFKIPYAMLIGVLIAFTALIPLIGAFIGCFVGAFLVLTVAPIKAVYFVIIFLVLQQIEGNLIYPHVVGNSIGLPSIWVLVAVTVGGGAFGVAGMLVGIPLFSVLYSVARGIVNLKLEQKSKNTIK